MAAKMQPCASFSTTSGCCLKIAIGLKVYANKTAILKQKNLPFDEDFDALAGGAAIGASPAPLIAAAESAAAGVEARGCRSVRLSLRYIHANENGIKPLSTNFVARMIAGSATKRLPTSTLALYVEYGGFFKSNLTTAFSGTTELHALAI